MLMDAETGLMPSDVELINTLRKYSKKIFYVVNKIDGPKKEKSLYDFHTILRINFSSFKHLIEFFSVISIEVVSSTNVHFKSFT